MDIAALIAWIVTAGGGAFMLTQWLVHRGPREHDAGASRLSSRMIFGHAGLAATGLVLWIAFVITGAAALPWIALALLLGVASIGAAMFVKWLGGRGASPQSDRASRTAQPPEQHFPLVVVAAHGTAALTTVALVLLTALGLGV